jgi:hypothetical protein
MEPLDPGLQRLVDAERREVEPTLEERQRVARSLSTRVGVGFGAALGLSAKAAGAAAASSSVGLALKVSVALLVAGSAALVVVPRWTQREAPPARAALSVPPAMSHTAPPALPDATSTPLQLAPSAKTDDVPAPAKLGGAATHALPPLAEEARLLKQAQQALRAGEPQAALTALAEHQRRFPRGQLTLERSAARVTALCALGRTPQALSAAEAFLQQHPQSGLSQQVRASCGLASENP